MALTRIEHRILVARADSRRDLRAGQRDLAIFAGQLAVRTEQHGHVVDQMLITFEQTGDDIEIVFGCELPEIFGRWAGHRFRAFSETLPQPIIR